MFFFLFYINSLCGLVFEKIRKEQLKLANVVFFTITQTKHDSDQESGIQNIRRSIFLIAKYFKKIISICS